MRIPESLVPAVLRLIKKAADICYGARMMCFALMGDWRAVWLGLGVVFAPARPYRSGRWYRLYRTESVRAKELQRCRVGSPTRRIMQWLFAAMAHPDHIVWVRPEQVTLRARNEPALYCNDILAGDWDLDTRPVDTQPKHRAVSQRFVDGVAWRDTDLFAHYARRLEDGAAIYGARNLSELERLYTHLYDDMARTIEEHGLHVSAYDDGTISLPHVHIGRDGRLLFGDNGNHRLALAKLFGVKRIPCRVRARHLAWQLIRERLAAAGPGRSSDVVDGALATHPDLVDLTGTGPALDDAERLEAAADLLPALHGTPARLDLRWLARQTPAGTAVVHVGGWLGAGTAQLALGIRERAEGGEVRLHAYDRWRANRWDVRQAARRDVRLKLDEDLLPRIRQAFEPYGVPIAWGRAEDLPTEWGGDPVSLYVDDGAAEPELGVQALLACAGSWVPGHTVVVFLDSIVMRRTGHGRGEQTLCRHLPTLRSACFAPVESARPGVFRYTAPIDLDVLAGEARDWLSATIRTRSAAERTLRGAAMRLGVAVSLSLLRLREQRGWFAQ